MAKIAFGFFLLFFLELWVIIKVGSVLGAFMVILLMIFVFMMDIDRLNIKAVNEFTKFFTGK